MGRKLQKQPQSQQDGYTLEQLVALNPYNLDIFPDLENYVNEQHGGGETPHGSLGWAIDANFGALEALIQKMSAEGAALQESGWMLLTILFTSLCHTDVYFWEAKVEHRFSLGYSVMKVLVFPFE